MFNDEFTFQIFHFLMQEVEEVVRIISKARKNSK